MPTGTKINSRTISEEIFAATLKEEKRIPLDQLLSFRVDGGGTKRAIEKVMKRNKITKASADEVFLIVQLCFTKKGYEEAMFVTLFDRYLRYLGYDDNIIPKAKRKTRSAADATAF